MQQPFRRVLAWSVAWSVAPLLFAGDVVVHAVGGNSSATIYDVPVIVAWLACWLVGVVVTGRAPEQPAGWAFLGLAGAVAWSAFLDDYYALSLEHPDLPAWRLAAALGDSSFVWWFVFLALVIALSTPLQPASRLARWLPIATLVGGVVFQATALVRSTPLDPPRQHLHSPLAVAAVDGVASAVAAIAIYGVGVCLVASVVLLVRAFRRATGQTRQQLLWIVTGAVPLAPGVVVAFAASVAQHNEVASLVLGLCMLSLVIGAGLSVLRYRLFDVERVVTESAAYAVASVAVVLAFVAVLVVVNRTTPIAGGSQLPTVLATLGGVAVARASYVWARRAVGRRVAPARFDAVDGLRAGLAGDAPDLDVLVADVVGPSARVLYPAGPTWVGSDGRAVTCGPDFVDVRRHDRLTARVEFDPAECERSVVEAVAAEAAAEIDNVALRAELARQLELITASRARLANAHLEERRRIERDLHDGAQQRLLAIALQLQGSRLNGDTAVLAAEVDRAIDDLRGTVQELRDLAAGLQPAALAGGGLLAAVSDLAARAPIAIDLDVVDRRFAPEVEGAGWFVVAEAVTNALKHSGAEHVSVRVSTSDGRLLVTVADHGKGAADTRGRGLQGLADRVAAAGGELRVVDLRPHGTSVEAAIPCAS